MFHAVAVRIWGKPLRRQWIFLSNGVFLWIIHCTHACMQRADNLMHTSVLPNIVFFPVSSVMGARLFFMVLHFR